VQPSQSSEPLNRKILNQPNRKTLIQPNRKTLNMKQAMAITVFPRFWRGTVKGFEKWKLRSMRTSGG
jgi:hypothetical protein